MKVKYQILKAFIMICCIILNQSFSLSKYQKSRRSISKSSIYNNLHDGMPVNCVIDYRSVKGTDNRESLPFVVIEIGGTKQKEIGTYLLDSTTSCGDVLELGEKGIFKVKRVRYLYKYEAGKFRVFKKKLDTTSIKSISYEQSGYNVQDILQ